ncbi:hypothetical protein [Delftia sp. WSY_14]|uniref:hypothetical protein n=1 Tax=Delftia TaxID=80865 RepID=UPI00370B7777
MINERADIKKILDTLLINFKDASNNISQNAHIESFPKVDEWRYSKGDFFNPIPYRSEIDGFNSPKLLKKKYDSPFEAIEKGNFSTAFNNNHPTIIIAPKEKSCNFISTSLYGEYLSSDIANVHHIDLPYKDSVKNLPRLNGYGYSSKEKDGSLVSIIVGRNNNYSINIIEAIDNLPSKETAYASGWADDIEYHYHHDNNGLFKITTHAKNGGLAEIWSRS